MNFNYLQASIKIDNAYRGVTRRLASQIARKFFWEHAHVDEEDELQPSDQGGIPSQKGKSMKLRF
jgi:hypothetical protein